VATRGGVIEPADEAEIQSLNPGIRIERVSDAGHMIPWDNLEGFLAAADRLLGTALAAKKAA
jgi:N-formylmaleamate deformylase